MLDLLLTQKLTIIIVFLNICIHNSSYEAAVGAENQLKERKALTQKDLVSFSYQIARGMEYLASRRVSIYSHFKRYNID